MKMNDLLNDVSTYKLMDKYNDDEVFKKSKKFTKKYEKNLTAKEAKFISDFEYKSSNIYGLPKIHKCEEIIAAIKEQNDEYITITAPASLTFRPIIAGPVCPTS